MNKTNPEDIEVSTGVELDRNVFDAVLSKLEKNSTTIYFTEEYAYLNKICCNTNRNCGSDCINFNFYDVGSPALAIVIRCLKNEICYINTEYIK